MGEGKGHGVRAVGGEALEVGKRGKGKMCGTRRKNGGKVSRN